MSMTAWIARRLTADTAFGGLLFLLVLVRGLTLGTVLSPFTGWDAYQHLAVAAVLDETGTMPRLEAVAGDPATFRGPPVPRSLWPYLRRYPHPDLSAQQLTGLGVRNFAGESFRADGTWETSDGALPRNPQPPPLYQAQHPPLYYHLLVRLKHLFSLDDPLAWADAARIANVVFAAITAVLWFVLLRALCGDGPLRVLACGAPLLLASNSLYYYNHVRVANDGLCILFCTGALALYAIFYRQDTQHRRRAPAAALAMGVLLGLGALTKSTALPLVPAFVLLLPLTAWRSGLRPATIATHAGLLLGAYLLVAGWLHADTYRRYGTFTAAQHMVENRAAGVTTGALLDALGGRTQTDTTLERHVPQGDASFLDDRMGHVLRRAFFYDLLHVGGWTYRKAPDGLASLYRKLLGLSALLLVAGLFFQASRQRLGEAARRLWPLGLLLAATWSAMVYSGLHARIAFGFTCILAWYGIIVAPALFALLLLGATALARRAGIALTLFYAVLFTAAYAWGTYADLLLFQTRRTGFNDAVEALQAQHALLHMPVAVCLACTFGLTGALWVLLLRQTGIAPVSEKIEPSGTA